MTQTPEIDRCPYCEHEHTFDTQREQFVDSETDVPCNLITASTPPAMKSPRIECVMSVCVACGAVIAVLVDDGNGSQLYLPPTEDWNQNHGY